MRIIPVLDLMGGQIVRGIAGRRQEYRPIVSKLTSSTRPEDVARAFRDQLGLHECYLADLDAIAGRHPALQAFESIQTLGIRLWIDAGVRGTEDAIRLADAGVDTIVVGLETISGPEALSVLCDSLGRSRILFSLDLKDGVPLGDLSKWQGRDANSVAMQAIDLGIGRLLVLDLARVGTGAGSGTDELCASLRERHPQLELCVGGGVRDGRDLRRLKAIEVDAVLVASALHDGRLSPADWANL